MPTYQEYQEQIAKLQVLAKEARQDEIAEARRKVRELMQQNNLNEAHFAESAKKSSKAAKKQSSVQAKYRDPTSGQTWTGRGRSPKWLDGKSKEEFLIK